MEYMSDLLCISMELFLSYQDRSSTSDAILGHIPSFSYGDDHSLIDLLQFSSLGQEILYLLYWSLFLWFSSRWVFGGAWHLGCDCPAIHDPTVDCFDEIVVVTLVDHPFEMTIDSSNRASWDRNVWLIVTSRQASWSRQMGCETMFIIDLIIPTSYQSIF